MKKNVFYLFTLSVVLWSCSHDQIEFPIDYDVQFSVELAKVWFEAYGESEVTIRSSTCCPDVDIEELKPMFDWDLADLQENADWSVVELPWEFENGYVSVSASDVKEYTENNEQDDATQLIRLVVMKNKSTGNIYGFKMMIIPDSNYVLNNSEELETNTYLNRSAGLNGYVMFYSLTDEFVNGWKYVDGQVVNKIEEADPEYYIDPETNGSAKLRSSRWDYVTVRTCYYSQYSIDGGETWSEPRLEGCNSQTYTVLVANSGPGFGGGYSLEFGGTDGGGGSNNSSPTPPSPVLQSNELRKIANNVTMSDDQIKKLNEALENLIDEGCMQKALYDALVEKNVKLDFGMKTGTAPGAYNPYTKRMSFDDKGSITSEILKEELFHAWQDAYYPGGIAQYGKDAQGNKLPGLVNIEFETKVFKDIARNLDYGCCYIFGDDNIPLEIQGDYFSWIDSIQKNVSLLDVEYEKWLNLFNQYYPEYFSLKNDNLSLPTSLKSLIKMSNCFKNSQNENI